MITKTGQSRAGRAALPAWTARKRREKEAGGGGGGGNVGEPANKQVSWVGRVECRGALTLGSGAGGNQPVHPVGPPHSPAVVTLILAFLALLVNVCPGRGGGVRGSAGADLVGQGGGVSILGVPRALWRAACGTTLVPPLGPMYAGHPAERAGLGGAVARWKKRGRPHPLSCFAPLQRPITVQAPAPCVASHNF